MMEPVVGSDRLFTAFERAGFSPGAELYSASGPGGSPAESIVRAFEAAMDSTNPASGTTMPGSDAVYGVEPGSFRNSEVVNATEFPSASAPGPAEYVPGHSSSLLRAHETPRPEFSTRSIPGTMGTAELQSPVELYQTQYQLGLLRAHLNVMVQSSQSMTQSLETALKQSG